MLYWKKELKTLGLTDPSRCVYSVAPIFSSHHCFPHSLFPLMLEAPGAVGISIKKNSQRNECVKEVIVQFKWRKWTVECSLTSTEDVMHSCHRVSQRIWLWSSSYRWRNWEVRKSLRISQLSSRYSDSKPDVSSFERMSLFILRPYNLVS